jgi:hypothetical protein
MTSDDNCEFSNNTISISYTFGRVGIFHSNRRGAGDFNALIF